MAEIAPFKEFFNVDLVETVAGMITKVHPQFESKSFVKKCTAQLEPLSLSERSKMIAAELANHLPTDFEHSAKILIASMDIPNTTENIAGDKSWLYMAYGQFVVDNGIEYLETSLQVLQEITMRFSAEFAIRPFLVKYPDELLSVLENWARHDNFHVRRLVSEGTRPMLPWGIRLHQFKNDPAPVLKLLEILKTDESLYVRRSVANNLNDIAKDHPGLVIETLKRWQGLKSKEVDWVIKHAARSLIKYGNPDVLILLGYNPNVKVKADHLKAQKTVNVGNKLSFDFTITSSEKSDVNLMIDYVIYYMKANGKMSPKVFKMSQKKIKSGEVLDIGKKHSFKPVTTRVLYPGLHKIAIQVNGKIMAEQEFELLEA